MLKIFKRKWLVLISVVCCIAMLYIDMLGVAVLLPTVQNLWGISDIHVQWIINTYVLSVAVLVTAGGRVCDIIGTKKSFLIGTGGFLLSSMLCGIAPTFSVLLIGRVLQGIFCSILLPSTSVNVINAFPPKQVGLAMGIYVGSSSIFLILGPFVAGFLTQYLSWRWVFYVNLPFSVTSIFLAKYAMRKKKILRNSEKQEPFDWLGFVILGFATLSLVYAIMEGSVLGWNSSIVIILFFIAIGGGFLFYRLEKKQPAPLVDFSIFRSRNYKVCAMILFLMQICIITRIFLIVLLQIAYGYSPTYAALFILPSTLPVIFMAPVAGWLLQKFGPRLPILIGISGASISFVGLLFFINPSDFWVWMSMLLLFGFSVPMALNPSVTTALTCVDISRRGVAAGIINLLRQLSATIGYAVIGVILNMVSNYHFQKELLFKHFDRLASLNISPTDILVNTSKLQGELANLDASMHSFLHHLAMSSYVFGFRISFIVNTTFVLLALFLAFWGLKKRN